MKTYEEWYKENMYDRTETEKAWRAALEWILSHPGWGCAEDEVHQAIREELKQ